jgi:hypothetical protein
MQKPFCKFEHVGAEAGDTLVRPRIPGCRCLSEHRLEAEPLTGADLRAVGRELAERIAAPGQERQHASFVIEGKVGKIAPPGLSMGHGVGTPLAGRLDDERVEERHLLSGKAGADDLPAGHDLRAGPSDSLK